MNSNLAKIGCQFQKIWKQLGTNKRGRVVLASGLVLLGVVGVVWWSGRTEYGLLYGKLTDGEASRAIAALDVAKIPYKLSSGGGSILVPADKIYRIRMQLAGKLIPRNHGVGFEMPNRSKIAIPDNIQRAYHLRAIQDKLARTIERMDAVESARVMVVVPENHRLVDCDKRASASVWVSLRDNDLLPQRAVDSIRFLVAHSFEGLEPNFVTVVDSHGNVLHSIVEDYSRENLKAPQLGVRRTLASLPLVPRSAQTYSTVPAPTH